MKIKQIKNYIVLAIIVFGGLLTVWNQFNPETEGEELALVDHVQADTKPDSEPDTDVETEQSNNANTDSVTSDLELIEADTAEADTTDVDTAEADRLYNEAQKSIENYPDVLGVVWLDKLDLYIIESYEKYNANGWYGLVDGQTSGTKAGGRWGNYDDQLPEYNENGKEITYKEFDVNDKKDGQTRDAQRFVVGNDGSVYVTLDHYDTYAKIIK